MRTPTTSRPDVVEPPGRERRAGFQPAARRRNRIALGVALAAVAIGGNLFVYSTLDDAEPVVQVVRDVPAGAQLTADMLRTVEVDADPTVNVIPGDEIGRLVGSYAKVRLVSGSLVTAQSTQPGPLVGRGSAVVAIQVAAGTLPIGLRERVPVDLVIPTDRNATPPEPIVSIGGIVVGLPTAVDSALGIESLSVEVDAADAAAVAAANDVRVVLLDPAGVDEP